MTNVAMISTGDELLIGQITDTNASYAGEQLKEHGLNVVWRFTVGDTLDDLHKAFGLAGHYAEAVIVCGGLGPTSDDLTSLAAAEAAGVELETRQSWVDTLVERYAQRGIELNAANLKQAELPKGSKMLDNPRGSACGFSLDINNVPMYFLPGVPHEFKHMLVHEVIPDLQKRFSLDLPLFRKSLTVMGLSESRIEEMVGQLNIPESVRIGFRAAGHQVEVKCWGESESEINNAHQSILTSMADFVFSPTAKTMAGEIQHLMTKRKLTLCLAESCTGGLLSHWLVSEPGSSQYFDCSAVTYAYAAKEKLLGVEHEQILSLGAVSEPVVKAMAEGIRKRTCCDISLSISGIAGPDGGTPDKPVGTVCFGLSCAKETITITHYIHDRGRRANRSAAAALALDILRRYLLGLDLDPSYDLTRNRNTPMQSAPSASPLRI
ncbi:MAG: CinA family nicotinamide mononucleotide deamidase-related protein [bacterium]